MLEIDLIGLDCGMASCRRFKECCQLRYVPLARSKHAERKTYHFGRVDLKRVAKRLAGGGEGEVLIEQQ